MSRKEGKSTDVVIDGRLYTDDENTTGIQLTEAAWGSWLEDAKSFYYRHDLGGFTANKQGHRHGYFWYAYKRINGKLHKKYLGMRENVTAARLKEVADQFAAMAKA